ncbi:MAG: OmpA family protein [Phycisphaerae bacterium]
MSALRLRTTTGLLIGLAALTLSSGCADAEKVQISRLQDENARLLRENNDLKIRIQQALADLERCRADLARLQGELAAARAQLAATPIQPASTLPPGWERGPSGEIYRDLADDILFDSGKADLKASGRRVIEEVVQQIRSTPELQDKGIWVLGHTDRQPITRSKWADNLELSLHRGAAVTRELYNMGMDPRWVVAGGQGEHNPKITTDSLNVPQNRRVQILAIPKPPGGISTSGGGEISSRSFGGAGVTPVSDTVAAPTGIPAGSAAPPGASGEGQTVPPIEASDEQG